MLLPVRCFTCGKVISDKWLYYSKAVEEAKQGLEKARQEAEAKKNEAKKNEAKKNEAFDELAFYDTHHGKILDDLGLTKLCCRRHMLGHVDLIETI